MSIHTIRRAAPAGGALLQRAAGARRAAGQVVGAVAISLAAAGLTYLSARHGALVGLGGAIGAVAVVWFAGTRRIPVALALLMIYLGAIDGVLKLSTGSSAVTVIRDLLLYAMVIGLLIRGIALRQPLPAPPLSGWIVAFVALVLIQLFNPGDGTLTHSLAGIRQNLEFVPLFYLTFAFVRTRKALRVFVVVLALLGAANGVVNVVQSRLSPQQLASWGPGYAERVLGTNQFSLGGRTFYDSSGQQHTRPFGLMSDAGTGGLVGAFALGGIIALISLGRRRREQALGALVVVPVVAGIITSQGRAVLVASAVVALTYAAMTARSRGRVTTLLAMAAVAGVALFIASGVFAGTATRYAGLNASHFLQTTDQARGKSFAAIPNNLIQHPFGAGLGTGGPAAGQSGAPAGAQTANAENEISFATLEAGIPGMLVLIGFTGVVFATGFRRCRLEPDPEVRLLLAAIIAPVAGILALYTVSAISPTSPGGPYLWSAGGIVAYWLIARPAAQAWPPAASGTTADRSTLVRA